jgi:hypothetical protein
MNSNMHQVADLPHERAPEQRFVAAGREPPDPVELERLRQRDREVRMAFAAMRRSTDAYLRSQRP